MPCLFVAEFMVGMTLKYAICFDTEMERRTWVSTMNHSGKEYVARFCDLPELRVIYSWVLK